jgi:hypothetical protein
MLHFTLNRATQIAAAAPCVPAPKQFILPTNGSNTIANIVPPTRSRTHHPNKETTRYSCGPDFPPAAESRPP